jgi:hypothetical protein
MNDALDYLHREGTRLGGGSAQPQQMKCQC